MRTFSVTVLIASTGLAACAPADWQGVLDRRVSELGYSGAQMAVVIDGELVFDGATGVADRGTDRLLTPDDPMRIASVTKPFTSALVLQLASEEQLSLDDRILDVQTDFPGDPATTLDHLARHTSGLADWRDDDAYWESRERLEIDQLLDIAYGQTPAPPQAGARFRYTSAGYLLLGRAAERAGGAPWEAQLQARIFEPLELGLSVPGDGVVPIPGYDGHGVDQSDHPNAPNSWASGSLIGTARDVARFGDALVHGEVLDEEGMEQLYALTPLAGDEVEDYGFGLRVSTSADGPYVGNRGFTPGYTCSWSYRPEIGATVAVLIPSSPHDGRALERAAWDHLKRLKDRE